MNDKPPSFAAAFVSLIWHARAVIGSLVLLVVVGGIVLAIEGVNVSGADDLTHNFGLAVYAAFITALTIGYGDMTPGGPFGRIAAVVLGLVGMLFIGVVVGACIKALERSSR